MDLLRNIGFYTLEDNRALNTSHVSRLWRCELILTSRCNFNCPYCRGIKNEDKGDISFDEAKYIIDLWTKDNLKNIRFSGGEPTLWPRLIDLIKYSKHKKIKRIAISTNGSADTSFYHELINAGVNDFSISLDSCCSSTGNKMSGYANKYEKVINNIRELSKITYVTIGCVITEHNEKEIDDLIKFSLNLGVSDIRLITAAQRSKYLNKFNAVGNYPILKYRLDNFKKHKPIRGISKNDNFKCPLVLDDMAILNGKHYPCIIYLREGGRSIGRVGNNMRSERKEWFLKHNCYKDRICRNNCLDVCVEYNNRVRDLNNPVMDII